MYEGAFSRRRRYELTTLINSVVELRVYRRSHSGVPIPGC